MSLVYVTCVKTSAYTCIHTHTHTAAAAAALEHSSSSIVTTTTHLLRYVVNVRGLGIVEHCVLERQVHRVSNHFRGTQLALLYVLADRAEVHWMLHDVKAAMRCDVM